MPTLSAYRMEIQPHLGQSPQECVEGICKLLSDFVVKHYRARKMELFPLSFDGQYLRPEKGSCLVAARSQSSVANVYGAQT